MELCAQLLMTALLASLVLIAMAPAASIKGCIAGDCQNGYGDCQNGYGVFKLSDGSMYKGDFKDGKQEGHGVYTNSGNIATKRALKKKKEAKSSQQQEEQQQVQHEGFMYEGQWKEGQMHGWGVFTEKDGRRYEGEWVNGRMHGTGTHKFTDGQTCQGEWEHGRPKEGGECSQIEVNQ
eukprot:g75249.t1